jgi:cytosine/uracil/thiamine/allantoin permease
MLAGLIYGAWVDGTSLALLGLYLGALITVLGLALWLVSRNQLKTAAVKTASTD